VDPEDEMRHRPSLLGSLGADLLKLAPRPRTCLSPRSRRVVSAPDAAAMATLVRITMGSPLALRGRGRVRIRRAVLAIATAPRRSTPQDQRHRSAHDRPLNLGGGQRRRLAPT
jgi:hypothetical protein